MADNNNNSEKPSNKPQEAVISFYVYSISNETRFFFNKINF